MKWSMIQLQKLRDKGLMIEETVDLEDDLKKLEPQIREATPVHITGKADISSTKITFHLQLKGTFILPCSRTLQDVHFPYDIETKETFLLDSYEFDEDTEEVHKLEGDVLDLKPIIMELLIIEIPMQVFSDEVKNDDAFLAAGKGWEVIDENNKEEKIDPRLEGLSKLLDSTDK